MERIEKMAKKLFGRIERQSSPTIADLAELASLENRIKELKLFPGSLSEYDSKTGEEHIIMDTGRREQFVQVVGKSHPNLPNLEYSLLSRLLDEGCVGIIRYVPFQRTADLHAVGGYGIPVKRKE